MKLIHSSINLPQDGGNSNERCSNPGPTSRQSRALISRPINYAKADFDTQKSAPGILNISNVAEYANSTNVILN